MAMPVIHRRAADEIDAQRRAEQRLLDVMDRDRVASEQRLDVPVMDQPRQVFPTARVDHDRAGHDHDLPFLLPPPAHFPRDPLDHQIDPALARDARAHERKLVFAVAVRLWQSSPRPQPVAARDHEIAVLQRPEERASRGPALIDHDHSIHPLVLDRNPFLRDSNLGWVNGRGVKVIRGDPVRRRGRERRVAFLGRDAFCPEREELAEDAVEPRLGRRDDAHFRARGAGLLLAEVEMQHLERAAVLNRHVHGFLQQSRVQQMPFESDDPLANRRRCRGIGAGNRWRAGAPGTSRLLQLS